MGGLEEVFGGEAADDFVAKFAVGIKEVEGRQELDAVGLAEGDAIAFFDVEFVVDEVFIHEVADFFLGEDIGGHAFAGAAPSGVGIDEDGFILGFGGGLGFFPRAFKEGHALCEEGLLCGEEAAKKDDFFHDIGTLL